MSVVRRQGAIALLAAAFLFTVGAARNRSRIVLPGCLEAARHRSGRGAGPRMACPPHLPFQSCNP